MKLCRANIWGGEIRFDDKRGIGDSITGGMGRRGARGSPQTVSRGGTTALRLSGGGHLVGAIRPENPMLGKLLPRGK